MIIWVFLCWLKLLSVGVSLTDDDFWHYTYMMPVNIVFYCPNASICDGNSSLSYGINSHRGCCSDCSCDEQCGLYNNCCFEDLDNYKLFQFENIRCYLTSTLDTKQLTYSEQAFFMIDKCPQLQDTDSEYWNSSDGECGEQNLYQWGSIGPVYSPKNKKIFKNEACALCYDVDDGIIFTPLVVCDRNPDTLNIESMIELFWISNLNVSGCNVHFTYPDHPSDIENQQCHKNLVKTCTPEWTGGTLSEETRKEVVDGCNSQLNSPVWIADTWYLNLFCAVCSKNDSSSIPTSCEAQSSDNNKNTLFVWFIDVNTINSFKSRNLDEETLDKQTACLHTNDSSLGCIKVNCPLGQVRFPTGQCGFYSDVWYVETLQVCLKLKMTELSVSNIASLLGSLISMLILDDLSNVWLIRRFYYTLDERQFLQEVLIDIHITPDEYFNISLLVNILSENYLKPFTLEIDGKPVLITPSFKEFCSFQLIRSQPLLIGFMQLTEYVYAPTWLEPDSDANISRNESVTTYYSLEPYSQHIRSALKLTKLFFCELVEYSVHEVVIDSSSGGNTIQIKNLEKVFHENEYKVLYLNDELKYRVCAEDIDFYLISSGKNKCKALAFVTWSPVLIFWLVL